MEREIQQENVRETTEKRARNERETSEKRAKRETERGGEGEGQDREGKGGIEGGGGHAAKATLGSRPESEGGGGRVWVRGHSEKVSDAAADSRSANVDRCVRVVSSDDAAGDAAHATSSAASSAAISAIPHRAITDRETQVTGIRDFHVTLRYISLLWSWQIAIA